MVAVMQGIRVLEVAEHTFVPASAAILADWGAEVIKVEHVERGDAMRGLGSTAGIPVGAGGVNILLEHANRGKQSIALDLTTAEGLDILYRLAATCDVFLTNKLPAVRAKLRIDVDDVRAHNPHIVYVSGTGYGARGPDVDQGGYDSLAYWARSGNAVSVKHPSVDEMPNQPAPALGDSIGAMFIAGGVSAALLHRERTGEATEVDVSLLATGMWAMSAAIGMGLQTGIEWGQLLHSMGGPRNPLVGNFRTADDRWLSFSMLQGFHYWPGMCEVLGHPEWITDARFATQEALFANGEEARALVAAVLATDTLAGWNVRLRAQRGQWAPFQNTLEVADDPMSVANGYVLETHTRAGTPFRLVTTPVQFGGAPSAPGRAPEFNEHGDVILRRVLGLDDDAIIDLKVKGVVA
jgi:crotonobetainyl-CoA:carnitine CoA-transferase CaiB-like acyl-CoA transferase